MKFHLSVFLLLSAFALCEGWHGPGHRIDSGKEELNFLVKNENPEIQRIISIPNHDNLSETLYDILRVSDDPHTLYQLEYLDKNAVSAAVGRGLLYYDNPLSPLYPNWVKTLGDLSQGEFNRLYGFIEELAKSYVQHLKEDYGEEKEIQVVPIAKLHWIPIAKLDENEPLHPAKKNDRLLVLLGVLGRRVSDGDSGKLNGFAGLTVLIE
ncbi:hypothetical protein Ddc_15356 [Ditylenchus destructor]|nr:hypothetical protein Ddc_15356 [Ditylenchus destructor]